MPDVSDTLTPNSTQLDNIDLRDQPPRVFTVTSVDVQPGTEQPVSVHLAEFDRPWKPGKNMRRVLAFCWGRESDNWVGKRVELFADERVKFGNDTPGGTRISRLSGIEGTKHAPVLLSQGRAGTYKVEPLPDAPKPQPVTTETLAALYDTFAAKGIPEDRWVSGANSIAGASVDGLESLTESEATAVLTSLASRPNGGAA